MAQRKKVKLKKVKLNNYEFQFNYLPFRKGETVLQFPLDFLYFHVFFSFIFQFNNSGRHLER